LQQQLLAIAEEKRDATFLMWAHHLGFILCPMGEFTSARSHLESAISLYDPARSEAYRAVYSVQDAGVTSRIWAAVTLCHLGYPDQALEGCRQALALARKLAHPFTLVLAFLLSADLHLLRQDGEAGLSSADECLRLGAEHGFEQTSTWAEVHRGRALIELNRAKEGIVKLEEGIAASRSNGSEFELASFMAALGNGYIKVGRMADGLSAIAEGLAVSRRTGERWFDAELYRLKGELVLKDDGQAGSNVADEAQVCFRQAIEIANRQSAKWWELRTTVSLARLLRDIGRRAEARTMLAEIYGWFTEGFDTADLKDAKALLDLLSA
jgi:adenylate cyclase